MKEKLFAQFPPVTDEQWKEIVLQDLKGEDFDKKLIWKTIEGIDVQPYYRADVLQKALHLESYPGEFPYVRGKISKPHWDISEEIDVWDVKETNKEALALIKMGITSLRFKIRKDLTTTDFEQLLDKIDVENVSINFRSGNRNGWYASLFSYYINKEGYNPRKIFGSDDFDSYGHMLKHGGYPCNHEDCLCAENLVDMLKNQMPNFKLISVNATHIQNAGGSVVQELGYGLAMGAEYFHKLDRCNISIDDMAKELQFIFTVGSNFFFEIAKLRAARVLWAKIVEAHNPKCDESSKMYMHCVSSVWNKTIYDPYTNLLRSSTEAMSAILGGTDSLSIKPFDFIYKKPDEFSRRIARNIQLILREEAHFNKIKDPGAGSYYIENLTNEIAEKSWELFLKVQENGGFVESFKKGIIQEDIERTAKIRDKNIAERKERFIGTNFYPNFNEVIKNIDYDFAFPKQRKTGNIGQPLKLYRGTEEIEKVRLATDLSEKRPTVFNFTIGDATMRSARAQFSSNFFGCAGFEIVENVGFDSIDKGLAEAKRKKADIIVVCSSDQEYESLVPEIIKKETEKIIVVAGNPKCRSKLEEAGVENFIHLKSNLLEKLKYYQRLLNIKPLNL